MSTIGTLEPQIGDPKNSYSVRSPMWSTTGESLTKKKMIKVEGAVLNIL